MPVALVAGFAGALNTAGSAGAQDPINYVALGDSLAAGPLIPDQEALYPCFRSDQNYPHLLAKTLNASTFRDVTCSSATTDNILSTPQNGVPIQIDAVTADTGLVTITIGANDAKLTSVAIGCLNPLPAPSGTSCKARNSASGTDSGTAAIDAVGPKIAAVIAAVHDRAPHARIVLTSYGNYIQPGGCYPIAPYWPEDADYLQGLMDHLGAMTATIASESGADYVDFIGPGAGHDGCNPPSNWTVAIVPAGSGVVPLHPTRLGEVNFARLIAEALG
ncbi:SGNH/GDSL hydrolase family protein [Nocardia sp. NBC_01388]|uniref:SGNH/GDSL hydrolase family protein n=1 Tax=Nocardia sp. NBC_01388 TaxID=2903596 RepID=UPI00324A3DEB